MPRRAQVQKSCFCPKIPSSTHRAAVDAKTIASEFFRRCTPHRVPIQTRSATAIMMREQDTIAKWKNVSAAASANLKLDNMQTTDSISRTSNNLPTNRRINPSGKVESVARAAVPKSCNACSAALVMSLSCWSCSMGSLLLFFVLSLDKNDDHSFCGRSSASACSSEVISSASPAIRAASEIGSADIGKKRRQETRDNGKNAEECSGAARNAAAAARVAEAPTAAAIRSNSACCGCLGGELSISGLGSAVASLACRRVRIRAGFFSTVRRRLFFPRPPGLHLDAPLLACCQFHWHLAARQSILPTQNAGDPLTNAR
jgi:hypothetical protein